MHPAHNSGISQGLHLQRHVPLTPGDGYRLPKCLLSAFVVTFVDPKKPTVDITDAPSLGGIGRELRDSTG